MAPQRPRPSSPNTLPSARRAKGKQLKHTSTPKSQRRNGLYLCHLTGLKAKLITLTENAEQNGKCDYQKMRELEGSSARTGRAPPGQPSSKSSGSRPGKPSGKAPQIVDLTRSDNEAVDATLTLMASQAAALARSRPSTTNVERSSATLSNGKVTEMSMSGHALTGKKRKRHHEDGASESSEHRNTSTIYHGLVDQGNIRLEFPNGEAPPPLSWSSTPRTQVARQSSNTSLGLDSAAMNSTPSTSKPPALPANMTTRGNQPIHPSKDSGEASGEKGKDKATPATPSANTEGGRSDIDLGELTAREKTRLEKAVKSIMDQSREKLREQNKQQLTEIETDVRKNISTEIEERGKTAIQPLGERVDERFAEAAGPFLQLKEEIEGLQGLYASRQALDAVGQETKLQLDRQKKTLESHQRNIVTLEIKLSKVQRQIYTEQDEAKNKISTLFEIVYTAKKESNGTAGRIEQLERNKTTTEETLTALVDFKDAMEGKLQEIESSLEEHAWVPKNVLDLKTGLALLQEKIEKEREDECQALLRSFKNPRDGDRANTCAAPGQEIERMKESAGHNKAKLEKTLSQQAAQINTANSKIQEVDNSLATRIDDRLADETNPIQSLLMTMCKRCEEGQRKHQENIDQMKRFLEDSQNKQQEEIDQLQQENKSLKEDVTRANSKTKKQSEAIASLTKELADTKTILQAGLTYVIGRVKALESQRQEPQKILDAARNLSDAQSIVEEMDGDMNAVIEQILRRNSTLEDAGDQQELHSQAQIRPSVDDFSILKKSIAEMQAVLQKPSKASEGFECLQTKLNEQDRTIKSLEDRQSQVTAPVVAENGLRGAQEADLMKRLVEEAMKAITERLENEIKPVSHLHLRTCMRKS